MADQIRQYRWLEAIGLFQQLQNGDYLTVRRLIETSAAPDDVVDDLLRMLIVFLRGEAPDKIERFVETAYRIGPPPPPPVFVGEA